MDGLSEERLNCRMKIHEFNHCLPSEKDKQQKLLQEILGKTGKLQRKTESIILRTENLM